MRERETHLGRPTKGKLKGREGGTRRVFPLFYAWTYTFAVASWEGRGVLKSKEAGRVHTTKSWCDWGRGGGFIKTCGAGFELKEVGKCRDS